MENKLRRYSVKVIIDPYNFNNIDKRRTRSQDSSNI